MAITWNIANAPSGIGRSDVVHIRNKIFIAFSSNSLMRSTDGGKNWTQITTSHSDIQSIASNGNGRVVMVGYSKISISNDDGATWTTSAHGLGVNLFSVVYDNVNGKFVAIPLTGKKAFYSTDGSTWATSTFLTDSTYYMAAAGNGTIVIPWQDTTSAHISRDGGVTWTSKLVGSGKNWGDIAFGTDKFIITVSEPDGSRQYGVVAADGSSGSMANLGISGYWGGVTYGDGKWIVLDKSGSKYAMSEDNGTSWTSNSLPSETYYNDVAYGGNCFVIVASGNVYYAEMNQAPTQPTNISATTPIKGGLTTTVSWGASSDVDGNLVGYKLERSINGGSWTQIYQGAATSYTDGITYGTSTVAYRVKACDSQNSESAYTTSTTYSVFNNVVPTTPANISVPGTIKGGKTVAISWDASTDSNGNLVGYILERRLNGGLYKEIYRGANTSFTDTIAYGESTVSYRVKAYDSEGAASAYKESATVDVINNTSPMINGSDKDLGTVTTTPVAVEYIVTDAQSDTVTVVEKFDGITTKTYTATLGATNRITWTDEEWLELLNGKHTIEVTATDPDGASAKRTWTFTKAVDTVSFVINTIEIEDMPNRCIVNPVGSFPNGSILTIKVCNNANDVNPAWEDISDRLGQVYYFVNENAATQWAFGMQVTLSRGTAVGEVYLDGINANFGSTEKLDLANYYDKDEIDTMLENLEPSPGVAVQENEPDDENVLVWVDTDSEPGGDNVIIDLRAGKSAYEVALDNGFDGTEEEWLASLKGDDYVLTEEDKEEIASMADGVGQQYEVDSEPKGEVFNDYEFNVASGLNSHAQNRRAKATGKHSHAQNYDTLAHGESSSASGVQTKAYQKGSVAEGCMSEAGVEKVIIDGVEVDATDILNPARASGLQTKAIGFASATEGQYNEASGEASHGEGSSNIAYGDFTHVEGIDTRAYDKACHTEGAGTVAGIKPKDTGGGTGGGGTGEGGSDEDEEIEVMEDIWASHGEGIVTKARGKASHSEGEYTEANGEASHTEGEKTIAHGKASHTEGGYTSTGEVDDEGNHRGETGDYAHAEGFNTRAIGKMSHSEGEGTVAKGNHQHVQGKYNTIDHSNFYAFIVGNGTGNNQRRNAFTLDWGGNGVFSGTVRVNSGEVVATENFVKSILNNSFAEKVFTITYEDGTTETIRSVVFK